MSEKEIVSLITPCYNTGEYIHRLLDSVLSQTYPYIEMIVVDDGSTDDSRSVIKSYIPKFEKKGFLLKYVYQENQGQSVAIKNGLQLIHGEYLAWPDSDDFYADETAILQMVDKLHSATPEFKMVRTQERVLEDQTFKLLAINGEKAEEYGKPELFYDCLYSRNQYYFCPGAYMLETASLYETTGFDIYTDRNAGQNWQLMLPMLYKYRCLTIKKPLYNVISRQTSHSRGQYKGFDATETKYSSYLSTQIETLRRLKEMPMKEKEIHIRNLIIQYSRKLFQQAIVENRSEKVKEKAAILRMYNDISLSEQFFSYVIVNLCWVKLGRFTYIIYGKFIRLLIKVIR